MSDPATRDVTLDMPGSFDIRCGTATNSTVTFEWDFLQDIIAFNVSIDGEDPDLVFNEPTGNSVVVENVTADEVTIFVTAVENAPNACGDITGTATCPTQNCPPSVFPDFGADNMFDAGCINEASGFNLPGAERLQNPPTTNLESESWETHPAVDAGTGAFDPSAVVFSSGQEVIDITYTVTYSDV